MFYTIVNIKDLYSIFRGGGIFYEIELFKYNKTIHNNELLTLMINTENIKISNNKIYSSNISVEHIIVPNNYKIYDFMELNYNI